MYLWLVAVDSFCFLRKVRCYLRTILMHMQALDMDTCNICNKRILSHSHYLKCDLCEKPTHIKCLSFVSNDDNLYTNRTDNIWFCTCCTKEIYPFNHYDDDEEHLNALSDYWAFSFDFVNNELSEKIFIPFDLNEDATSPLKEVDPDMNFYKEIPDTAMM